MSNQPFEESKHARMRRRQRGISADTLQMVCNEADRETPVGNGKVAMFISNDRLRDLIAEGVPAHMVEKIKGIVVLAAGGKIVTEMRDRGRPGRHYRHSHGGRHRQHRRTLGRSGRRHWRGR